MSKPKKRRRILLPIVLAAGLLSAGGAGAYFYWLGQSDATQAELTDAAQQDLDAGFAAAQQGDPLDAIASAWEGGQTAQQAHDSRDPDSRYAPPAVGNSRYEPLPLAPRSDDRYAAELPASDDEQLAEHQVHAGEVSDALEPDRYTAAGLPPLADADFQAEPTTVARGQSPADQPLASGPLAAERLPDDNPLRATAPDPFGGTSSDAREAFAAAEPLPAAEVGPQPAGFDEANPLRAVPIASGSPGAAPVNAQRAQDAFAGPPAEATPEPGEFAEARPMAEPDRYEHVAVPQEFRAEDELEPVPDMEQPPAEASVLSSSRAAPMASQDMTPFDEPQPYADFGSTPSAPSQSAIDEGTGRPGERALEGPQRPALVLQKLAPQEIQVGKPCKFAIKVRNVGQRPADNVVVEDEVPQGTRFVSASPQAETTGGTLVWQLGTLSPGEERTMEVELIPTDEGEIGSVAQVTFTSHASAKARCTRPQLALRMTAPAEVLVGRQQRVTIELHNPGTGDATGVMLLENVPEGVRHAAGPALEFEVGTLRAGETRRMELVLTAEKPGKVVNVLTARAEGNLQVQQEVEFEVIAPAIEVGVDGPAQRYLERPATYTVSIDNPGTAAARDVQLVTKLPKGMRFVRANNLGEYDSATHAVYWSLAELPEGQKGTVELVALPIEPGDHTIEVEGRAREGLEDRTTRAVRVEGLVAIMFTVTDSEDPIEVGGNTTYEVRVVNQGSKAASNVRVAVMVPPGLRVTGATGETRHSVEAEGVVFEPLARLAPKADTVYRIQVQGVQPGDQRLLVEVQTDDLTQPIRKEESTRVFGDE